MCMVDDGDPAEVFDEAVIAKSRKEHLCFECKGRIEKGESYRRIFMVTDGDAMTVKQCLFCIEASEWLNNQCGGYCPGYIYDDLYEHWSEGEKTVELGRLLLGMRRRRRANEKPKPEWCQNGY